MYLWASLVAQLVKNSPAVQSFVWFLGQDDSLEKDRLPTPVFLGFPDGSDGKEFACNAGELHLIPGLGNPLEESMENSCLENSMDRGSLVDDSPWGCKELDMTERLSSEQHIRIYTTICIYNFNMYGKVKLKVLVTQSSLTLFDPMDCIAHQAPISMEFPGQEYWRGQLFPSPGDLPNPGIESGPPALQADSLPSEPLGKHVSYISYTFSRMY